jgi:hypothetical protein
MNTAEILRGLLRRWYVVVPGILLSVILALLAWTHVAPTYERSARQLLLPGAVSIPEKGNPYLYIGGLSQAADVVVLAMGSNNVLSEIAEEHPGAKAAITRDTSTSSPVIVITVTAPSDAETVKVLDALVKRTPAVLTGLQDQEHIAADNRITVNTITVDSTSTVQEKQRVTVAAGVAGGGIVLSIVVAALLDGLIISRRRRGRGPGARHGAAPRDGGETRRQNSGDAAEWLDADDPAEPFTEDAESEVEAFPVEDHVGVLGAGGGTSPRGGRPRARRGEKQA